jgi:16S rRNA (guanine527-N7)-methyltransferase
MTITAQTNRFRETLRTEAPAYGVALAAEAIDDLSRYYALLRLWNARVHLVAPCSPEEFATRHILESLTLLKYLPNNVRVAEVGAGGGLPIIPCLIARSDLSATLIESSQKKAVFLREAVTHTGISARASVMNERFENVAAPSAEFVTCRALERFEEMLPNLFDWAPAETTLLLFGAKRLAARIESLGYTSAAELLPRSKGRFLFVVKKL